MQRKSEIERKILIERYLKSGLSVRAFCSGEGLAEQTLRNWIGKTQNHQYLNQGFVEVPSNYKISLKTVTGQSLVKAFPKTCGVMLHFPHNVSIEVFPDTDRATAEWIIEMLRGHE